MQSITLPQNPKFTAISDKSGKFIIEGCYPGYGTTLGNALRRVLLSSLSGAAITSVKIKGISHEFSTVPNVLEDVIQIVLNLKQIRFRMHSDEPIKVVLKAKGEKVITASMIECPSQVEVVNGEAHIATITNPKGEMEMEMEIGRGIGYVPVEQQERGEKEVGVIAVDAIYTPIRRVNYLIDNMRVGKRTDFERITLEIVTDGTIPPQEAFSDAVEILVNQFSSMASLDKAEVSEKEVKEDKEEAPEKIQTTSEEGANAEELEVSDLKGLSTRTLNVLEKSEIKKAKDIIKMTEEQVIDLPGMGEKGVKEIKKAIGELGFNLKKGEN
ncbi:MAG: DNA-directed RNA polymerase subunit alpha [Patescibacteria group bacterium]